MAKSEGDGKRLLLISNSTLYGSGYLDHAEAKIRTFFGAIRRVLFVPFALYDRQAYASKPRTRFADTPGVSACPLCSGLSKHTVGR